MSAAPAVNPFGATALAAVAAVPTPSEAHQVGPSTRDLLERAARLGPPRPTLESILLPTDPVLGQKLDPRIAERRVRFTRIVKATLGGCVALCVAALAATAMSGEASAAGAPAKAVALHAPVAREPSVESFAGATIAKAARATNASTAHAAKAPSRAKRR